jgi:hypothetical protein
MGLGFFPALGLLAPEQNLIKGRRGSEGMSGNIVNDLPINVFRTLEYS